MCAHIGQKRHIYPPSIYGVYFDSYTLPLLRRFTVGAAIEKNFFLIFIFLIFARNLRMSVLKLFFLFFRFFYSISTRILFFLFFSDFRLVSPILGFQLNSFSEYLRFNSFIFARYYLDCDFWLFFWFSTRIFIFSTRFYSHQVMPILCFNSSTLYLFCLL